MPHRRIAIAALLALAATTVGSRPAAAQALPAVAAPASAVPGVSLPTPPVAAAQQRPTLPAGRPRIGLVLSGGGARGLAHVGVLKVLEREHIPVDVIAGTSMGAIIGGLYASGMSASQLEAELLKVNWDSLFASRVERQQLSQRRKEEDFEISPVIEIGMHNGELSLPIGSVSSRGLELLLRRYTLGARAATNFDELPIPFRAVATDMENGAPRVLADGDLATALRSSMSVPGVFAPTDVGGRILGDGGLVDNLPVDVARAMGADVIIAVNIGTPLASRETLATLIGVTSQMINILTEQNVERSIATLDPKRDMLLTPPLGALTSGDFDRAREFIELGEKYAAGMTADLARYAVGERDWLALLQERTLHPRPLAPIAQVRFEGADLSHPARFTAQLESQPGKAFDEAAAERDSRLLAASGDYLRTDYRVEDLPAGTGLVFNLEEKPWGPHYFRIGLDMATDFNGTGDFNIKISHNRHWLTANGAEWRNLVQIGSAPRWFTEWYQPLTGQLGGPGDWFVAPYFQIGRQEFVAYQQLGPRSDAGSAPETARYARYTARAGFDVGQPWGRFGELRLGVVHENQRFDPEIVSGDSGLTLDAQRGSEWALRLGAVVDQLDFATFPTHGYRVETSLLAGRRSAPEPIIPGGSEDFNRFEFEASGVIGDGRQTLDTTLRVLAAKQSIYQGIGYYTLGGFQNLSGYKLRQLSGNDVLFGRLAYYYRLNSQPVLTRGFFAGATLEAGNVWARRSDVSLGELRTGMSAFLGADTGLGPLYFALAWAPRGSGGLYLVLGRP